MTTFTTKEIVLAILPKFSGVLSFLGSSYIFQDVLRSIVAEKKSATHRHFRRTGTKHQNKVKVGVYHRLVLGLSICDILASIVNIVGTWAIPKIYADTGTYMASGNIGTCTAMGFINEIGNLGAPIYNASLCIHYVLVIVVGMSEEKITKKGIELYLHLTPVISAFVFAILGLVFKLYNGAGSWCWFASYPPNCTMESIDASTGLPSTNLCTRGQYFHQFRLMHIGIAWVCLCICIVSMLSIYRKVYKQEKALNKYRHSLSHNKSYNGSKNQSHNQSNANTNTNNQHRHYTNNNENGNGNNIQSSNGNNYSSKNNSGDNNDSTADNNHGDTNKNHDDTNDNDKQRQVQFHSIEDDTSFTDHDHIESTEFNNNNNINIHNAGLNMGIQKSSNKNNSSNNSNKNDAKEKKKYFIEKMSSRNIVNYIQSHRSNNASENNEKHQENDVISSAGKKINKMKKNKKKSRQVADQGMFFVIGFFLTWLFPLITRGCQWLELPIHPAIKILFVIFFPLQGFFNALVYLRPKYLNYRRKQRKQKIQREAAEERKKEQIKQRITSIFYNNKNAKRNEVDFLKDNDDDNDDENVNTNDKANS